MSRVILVLLAGVVVTVGLLGQGAAAPAGYAALEHLFTEFLEFEKPPTLNGAPDYTARAMGQKLSGLRSFENRLSQLSTEGWPVDQQVDHALVRAQLSGLRFYLQTLQPWVRDPAFYKSVWMEQSDTPEHEGPTHHGVIEVWTYRFPLSSDDEARMAAALRTVRPLLQQARGNLTGNARDLWITGAGTMRQQIADLDTLAERVRDGGAGLREAIVDARAATEAFADWLDAEAPRKTGPSGIGKSAYTWSLQNVHLVPMTWDDEVTLLRRELDRAHAALKLEEQRNTGRPQIPVVRNEAEFAARASAGATKFLAFLKERNVLTVQDYLDPALRAHLGGFVPEERRNFFAIATHYEPVTLYAHFYHWFDHAWMREAPHASAIRRRATLYNVWDSRAEGMATAFEEIVLHAGYYDDNPRAREIVWIMLAQRAARGLASLYAHANEFDIAAAKKFQVQWTPRGWMREDLDLLGFEQQLYLRQPGYGTSYVTGKALIDRLIRARSSQLGDQFTLRGFFDELNAAGMMPVSLLFHQLTGAPMNSR